MNDRETRLRAMIDRLRDERDLARVDFAFLRDRDDYQGRLLLTLRARVREVQKERDEALAALWRERDAFNRKTISTEPGSTTLDGSHAAGLRRYP